MDLFLISKLVTLLLASERRVSLHTLKNSLDLDDQTIEAIRFELIDVKKVASLEDGSILVWVGQDGGEFPEDRATNISADNPEKHIPDLTGSGTSESIVHADAERRQITVMFCDLVGSTRLSTELDPEDLREIISSYQDTVRSAVKQFSGFIARYMGDGVLVYFGFPQAHEDDAERAVRASLAIVQAMSNLNSEIGIRFRVALSVRIGVATGPVVIGDIIGEGAAEEAAVIGEAPNLAARLQSEAEPDQVIVGSLTHQMVSNLFDYKDLGERNLKGIALPVRLWQVLGEVDNEDLNEGNARTGSLPLVGRQEELGLLTRSWDTSKEGQGQVVLIQGEGGIGKSRLVEALRDHVADQEFTWVTLRCSPFHTNSALFPILGHMQRVMGWNREDSVAEKLEKLEVALKAQSMPLEEAVPIYADLLSLPLPTDAYAPIGLSAKQKREQALDALVAWCFEEAERRPVIQVWDDIHWADPTTLEYLELYIEQSPTVPILNVLTYRPEFVLPWPMHSHMTPITLNRLEHQEVKALISLQAKGKSVPVEVMDHIISKADGVPLFVEELTKTILDSEIVQEEHDRFQLNGTLSEMEIPNTLQDSLMSRLDRVPTVREVAQMGAVLGREFAFEMLNAVVGLEESKLQTGLSQLVNDELLYQRGRGLRAKYIFKHALIQDAAYHSLLRSTRQQYHLRVAQLLEEQFQETVDTQPELVAHHYTEAGELTKAVFFWGKAGERARNRSANHEAIAYLTRGIEVLLELPDNDDRARLELTFQVSLGHANIIVKGHGAVGAETAYARARMLCERLGDVPELSPTLFGLWRFYVSVRPLQETLQIAKQLQRLGDEQIDIEQRVIAHYAFGYTSLCMGNLSDAQNDLGEGIVKYETSQRAAEIYRTAQDPGVACQGYLAMTQWLMGFPDQARNNAHKSIELAEFVEDPFSIAYSRCFTGAIVSEMCGDKINSIVTKGLDTAEQGGFSLWIAFGNVQLAKASFSNDKSPAALGNLVDIFNEIEKLGVHINTPYYMGFIANAYHQTGKIDDGLRILDQAQLSIDERDERWWEAEIHRLRGEFILSKPAANKSEVRKCFDRAIDISQKQSAKSLELRAAMSVARLTQINGGQDDGFNILRNCYSWFTEGFDTEDLRQAKQLLDGS